MKEEDIFNLQEILKNNNIKKIGEMEKRDLRLAKNERRKNQI